MTGFDVAVDGAIRADQGLLRDVTSWMMRRYADDVRRNGGAGSAVLMGFISACGESVRIREAVKVPPAELAQPVQGTLEVPVVEAAELMGCSTGYVRRLAREGRVRARKVGPCWLVDVRKIVGA